MLGNGLRDPCDGGNVLNQVEDSHSVADWREEMGAIGAEEQVALAVNCAKQVRELYVNVRTKATHAATKHWSKRTLKSVFIVTCWPWFSRWLDGSPKFQTRAYRLGGEIFGAAAVGGISGPWLEGPADN
jgi:hypothetical protein